MVNLAPGTGLPLSSSTRPVTSMISPWACPSTPSTVVRGRTPEFSGRRHVRKQRASLCPRGQERPQLSRLDVRKRRTRRKYRCRNPTCEQILNRGQALIGHVYELESLRAGQRDTDEM